MMRHKNLLLLIDLQHDFCHPEGTLYVPGALEDIARIAMLIRNNFNHIDHIILTSDNHQVMDISHPGFWKDSKGNNPDAFTQITSGDIRKGKWEPVLFKKEATEYINKLEQNGEFTHTIWPEHCIAGSGGAAIVKEIMQPLIQWARRGHFYDLVIKGTYPLTEHFGALRANVPSPFAPESQLNDQLVEKLSTYENVIVAGEAKSHCVANTIKQIFELKDFTSKLMILDDCMSNVTGFENIADGIYKNAISSGALITKSTEFSLR